MILEMLDFEEIGERMDRRMRLRESMIPAIGPKHLPDFVRELSSGLADTTDVMAFDINAVRTRAAMADNSALKTIFQSMTKAGIIPDVAVTPESLDYDPETQRNWSKGRKKVTANG